MKRMLLRYLSIILTASSVCAADRPPNLVVILTDDQGYADVGFNGCTDIPTPHIDRIAKEGVRCTSGYVTFAVCGPSRAGLITGRYQDRFGCTRNPTIDPSILNGVPVTEKNLAELLRPAGYTSMAVGKWHLGTHPDLRPLKRGFDEFFGFLSGGHDYRPELLTLNSLSEVNRQWDWYRTKLLRNEERVVIDDYLTDELSDAAVDFIERKRDTPFFLYVAYNAPHTPLQATEKYLARFPDIADQKRKTYAAMVSAVDDGVGRLLDTLHKHGLDERTIVFFLSDNGGAKNNASRNVPLRGHKGDYWEGGFRVPFAVRWAGTLPRGIDYDRPVSALDIAATIVAQGSAAPAPDRPLDGVDLVPYLTGKKKDDPHDALFWRFNVDHALAMRRGDDKLILDRRQGTTMLFDLASDIVESKDRSPTRTEDVAAHETALRTWETELVDEHGFPGLGSWKFK